MASEEHLPDFLHSPQSSVVKPIKFTSMGQENTLKTATLPLQEFNPVDATNLVNTYADDLVSGLFEDVDKLLDGDESVLARIEQETELAPESSNTDSEVDQAEPETPLSKALVPSEQATEVDAGVEASLVSETHVQDRATPPKKTWLGKLLDRFLITTTVFSLLGILGFVIYSYQRGASWVTPTANNSADTAPNQSDVEFLEYLDRSLEVIAKKAERNAVKADSSAGQLSDVSVLPVSPPLLPPLTPAPTAGGLMAPGGGPINVIERVYIPYQTTQQPTQPQVPQSAQVPQGAVNAPATQPLAPAMVHVLVGLLELGERSAALFEINGVSQRVYIGEPIANSGWSLVSVSSDEARIRRNGEVRSIYIGQQF